MSAFVVALVLGQAATPSFPAPGSGLRTQLLDLVRKELKIKSRFVVERMVVVGNWGLASVEELGEDAEKRDPDIGAPLKTMAVFRKSGSTWTLRAHLPTNTHEGGYFYLFDFRKLAGEGCPVGPLLAPYAGQKPALIGPALDVGAEYRRHGATFFWGPNLARLFRGQETEADDWKTQPMTAAQAARFTFDAADRSWWFRQGETGASGYGFIYR